MPSPKTNCSRTVVLLAGLMFELRLRPQPIASPERSKRSSSVSSQLMSPQDAGGAHVAPVLRHLVGAREVGERKARLDARPARRGRRRRPDRRSRPAARARTSACCSPRIGVQRTWTLRKNTMPVGPQYSMRVREDVGIHEGAPGLAGADRRRARPRRGAAGRSSVLRRRRCRTARTRTIVFRSPSWSASSSARRGGSAARRRRCCGPRRTPSRTTAAW